MHDYETPAGGVNSRAVSRSVWGRRGRLLQAAKDVQCSGLFTPDLFSRILRSKEQRNVHLEPLCVLSAGVS